MCMNVGVDPLASNKGFWAEILGVGDFYYELGVQIIDICIQTRPSNGGLISMPELVDRLHKKESASRQTASVDDVRRAVSKLKGLGSGFGLLEAGKTTMVLSVPVELNKDHAAVIEFANRASATGGGSIAEAIPSRIWCSSVFEAEDKRGCGERKSDR